MLHKIKNANIFKKKKSHNHRLDNYYYHFRFFKFNTIRIFLMIFHTRLHVCALVLVLELCHFMKFFFKLINSLKGDILLKSHTMLRLRKSVNTFLCPFYLHSFETIWAVI